jgi:hypothetical protein
MLQEGEGAGNRSIRSGLLHQSPILRFEGPTTSCSAKNGRAASGAFIDALDLWNEDLNRLGKPRTVSVACLSHW